MNKKMALMGLGLSMLVHHAFSANYGYLVNIFNKSPYAVRIQTTDRASTMVKMDGSQLSANDIKDKPFNLADISSFSFAIPWGNWDGQARIYIDVLRDYNDSSSLVTRYELLERDFFVELWKLTDGYDQNTQKEIDSRYRTTETHYSLLVDEAGTISLAPPVITLNFTPYHSKIQVGSPNCSIENDVSKQFTPFAANQRGSLKMIMRDTCKVVVNLLDNDGNPTDESATACFGFATKDNRGRFKPYSPGVTKIASHYSDYHEIGCSRAQGCEPDPDTLISPCDKLRLSWVEGNDSHGNRIIRDSCRAGESCPESYSVYYGIVDTND